MKRIRRFTRSQMLFTGFAVLLLGAVAVVPWRVVAQEAKSEPATDKPETKKAAEPKAPTDSGKPADPEKADAKSIANDAALAKQLVGTWSAPSGKEVTFDQNGNYNDYGARVFYINTKSSSGASGEEVKSASSQQCDGTWKISDGNLILSAEKSFNIWTGKPDETNTSPAYSNSPCKLKILKLDEEFLRLNFSGWGTATVFLRRVDRKSAEERFAAAPADLRQFFATAQFTPEEAESLIALFKVDRIDLSVLQTIARVQEARRRTISLQTLFGMTPEELMAVDNLLEQHKAIHDYTLDDLVDSGQLTPAELSGFKKTQGITTAFLTLAKTVPISSDGFGSANSVRSSILDDLERRSARGDRGRSQRSGGMRGGRSGILGIPRESLTETQIAANDKLFDFLTDLHRWYTYTVLRGQR